MAYNHNINKNPSGMVMMTEVNPKYDIKNLKSAIAEIGHSITRARDALIEVQEYRISSYRGVSLDELDNYLGLVEQAQQWLEEESYGFI